MADPARTAYRPDWAAVFTAVMARDADQLDVELVAGGLQPQALLESPLLADADQPAGPSEKPQDANPPYIGPYVRAEATAAETVYILNPRYFARTSTQPREIVQRICADAAAGVAALRRGEIQVLDRLDPWQVKSLRADDGVSVQAYALPRLHCLVPNARKPLTASRTFRRALAYGIDRQAALGQLLRGDSLPGCVALHGPMPVAATSQDPLDYASNPEIKPWPYDPRLAMALAETARRELAGTGKGQAASEKPFAGSGAGDDHALVLAYPADDIAYVACQALRQQLATADIQVELKELPEAPLTVPANVDLLYVELALWEPVSNAPQLLGDGGLAEASSGQMIEALGQLQRVADWSEAAACLRRIDRLAHDELAVVPLWQLADYFAYRKGLGGIANSTLTLYQNVEQWKPGFQYPSEK